MDDFENWPGSWKSVVRLAAWLFGGGITLLLAILVFPVVWFTLANEAEQLYKEDGQEPPISTIWGLWFLLPIIGLFVWYIKIQGALNDYWSLHGQTNDPGI